MQESTAPSSPLPLLFLILMGVAFGGLGVILPLRTLYFYQAFPGSPLERWLLLPTKALFPHRALISAHHPQDMLALHRTPFNWDTELLLWSSLVAICILYLFALRLLPKYITYRYVVISTAVLGLILILYPALTSQDVFSYIIYARLGVMYHHNPLTTLPEAIAHDTVYQYIFWITQPSAYGPTWIGLTSFLQWLALLLQHNSVVTMVLFLRLLGLCTLLATTALLWTISGALLPHSSSTRRARLSAALAMAWNPLLLFEACVNAHNDIEILFFILLAFWLLVRWQEQRQAHWLIAASLSLALATCLKITFIVLYPGLLLFLLLQERRALVERLRLAALSLLSYVGSIGLLYGPFWQHGAVLRILEVNPSASMVKNTPYELLVHLYAWFSDTTLVPISAYSGSFPEIVAHAIASALFILAYLGLIIATLRHPAALRSLPALMHWMALSWLLFCLIGSTWYWPWYLISAVGVALLALASDCREHILLRSWPFAATMALLALCMLSVYSSYTWGFESLSLPGLVGFQISWLRGLWEWAFLLLALPLAIAHLRRRGPGQRPQPATGNRTVSRDWRLPAQRR